MNDFDTVRDAIAPPRSRHRLLVLLAVALLAPGMLFGFVAWRDRIQLEREAAHTAERTAWVIREHALKVFETHELVLGDIRRRLSGRTWQDITADAGLRGQLTELTLALPHVVSIMLADASGRVRVQSHGARRVKSVAHRDYFAAHPTSRSSAYIGTSYISPISGQRVFSVSMSAVDAHGEFDGVIVIEVSLLYFTDFWRHLVPNLAYIVPMIREDGALLVRYPAADNPQRLDPDGPFVQATRRSRQGLYTATSLVDGVERLNAYTKLGDYPVFASFSVETRDLMRRWRESLWGYALLGTLATGALLLAMVMLLRHTRRERAAAHAWQHTARRLEAEMRRRETAEETLRQAQKIEAIGQITGGVAHDFNNLLQSVSLNLYLARASRQDPERCDKHIGSALDAIRRGSNLTQQLLAFARRQPLAPKPTDVNALVLAMTEMLQRSVGDDARIDLDTEQSLWPAMIDRNQAEMALLNLALNARDAMAGRGTLTVRTRNITIREEQQARAAAPPGDYVVLSVTDTGVGMSEETRRRAFEPFFTTKDVGKGSGLGLSQVHGFAAQSGGAVVIESRPGRGTTVSLYLPRSAVAAQAMNAASAPSQMHGRGETILVVDDETLVRKSIAATLGAHGYEVREARNGPEALEVLEREPAIHVLLTDYAMPGMRGDELARAVKTRRPGIKVALITGYADIRNSSLHEWQAVILHKPFTPARLLGHVADLLRQPHDDTAPSGAGPHPRRKRERTASAS